MSHFAALLLVSSLSADPCPPAVRAALADEFIAAMRRAQGLAAEELRFEPDEFRVQVLRGHACAINLHNFAAEYCATPQDGRAQVIARFVRIASATCRGGSPLPATYAAAKPLLLPVVRGRLFVEAGRAMMAGADRLAGEPLGEHLFTLLPRTDVVVFIALDKRDAPLASAPFEDVLRALGPRAAMRPGYPARWEVKELPPAAELAKLGRLPDF